MSPYVYYTEECEDKPGFRNIFSEHMPNGRKCCLFHHVPAELSHKIAEVLSYHAQLNFVSGKYEKEIAETEARMKAAGIEI